MGGNLGQHRLRFYAQARTKVADRASQERTLSDILVGTTVGTIGNEMGAIGANQETSKKRQECIETHQKECVLRVSDGVERATNSINKWTILDSNQRPPRCQATLGITVYSTISLMKTIITGLFDCRNISQFLRGFCGGFNGRRFANRYFAAMLVS